MKTDGKINYEKFSEMNNLLWIKQLLSTVKQKNESRERIKFNYKEAYYLQCNAIPFLRFFTFLIML